MSPALFDRRAWLAAAAAGVMSPQVRAAGPAASITATLLDGTPFNSEALKGQVLLVNFWATWCGPCRTEMPALDGYFRQHRERGLSVLALSVDELADEAQVREVAKPFAFAVAMMKSARLSGFGRIWRMPVCAVFDREGRLVRQDWFLQPQLDAAALDAVIQPLLGV